MASFTTQLILFVAFCSVNSIPNSDAVYCWKRRYVNGTCSGLLSWRAPETKCCEAGGSGVAFSAEFRDDNIFKTLFVKTTTCNPCKGKQCSSIRCSANRRCVQMSQGVPQCVCAPDCSKAYAGVVCGSDGKTYTSECQMLNKGCQEGVRLTTEYHGICRVSCHGVTCSHGKVCVPGRDGRSFCIRQQCPAQCTAAQQRRRQLQCGVDDVTYRNHCHLKQERCKRSKYITIAYMGPCQPTSSCSSIRCPRGKHCVLDARRKPRCIFCPCISPQFASPTCGSSGATNNDWCQKCKQECKAGRSTR